MGVFITGERGVPPEATMAVLEPHRATLETRLGVTIKEGPGGVIAEKSLRIDITNRANWDQMADWLHTDANDYEAALRGVFGG